MSSAAGDEPLRIERLQLGPFGTNAYIVSCRQTGDSVLIDAPAEAAVIREKMKATHPRYILLTHTHRDHTGALEEIRAALKVPVAAHPTEADRLPAPAEIRLNDGDTISVGNINLEVRHTPGHTPGGLCFKAGRYLVSGDTIFPGGPGRTSSPADFRQIIRSIKEKLLVLPDDTQVYPGHGEATTIGQVRREFAVFASRPHPPELCGEVNWLSS